jgi:hypothetical protein
MILNINFSIKIIRQSRRGQKKFMGGKITESITENYYFSKYRGGTCPPGPHWIRPLETEKRKKKEIINKEEK